MVLSRLDCRPDFNNLDDVLIASFHPDKWLALRVSLVLTVLLAGLLGFVAISLIEIIIAILSVAASGIARLLILFHTGNGQEHAASELIMVLEAMGTAGVGTLVVLYLLA